MTFDELKTWERKDIVDYLRVIRKGLTACRTLLEFAAQLERDDNRIAPAYVFVHEIISELETEHRVMTGQSVRQEDETGDEYRNQMPMLRDKLEHQLHKLVDVRALILLPSKLNSIGEDFRPYCHQIASHLDVMLNFGD